nr:hypothetical protein C4D60_Mb00t05230 [Ipomoea batatas]
MEEILTVTACRTEGFSAKYLRIQDFPQDLSQLLPGFHGFVEERSRDVNRHRIVAFLEGLNRVFGDGINILDGVLDGFRHECSENQLPELQMVVSLVKENGLFPQHPLFASREYVWGSISDQGVTGGNFAQSSMGGSAISYGHKHLLSTKLFQEEVRRLSSATHQ